jgi:glucose/arabinose dehydrogenase
MTFRTNHGGWLLHILLLTFGAGCNGSAEPGSNPPANDAYGIERAFPNLSFNLPVDLQNSGDGSGRLFVVEQAGRIVVFDPANPGTSDEFLDITGIVNDAGWEEGLLGLAFPPDFTTTRYYFVYYTLLENNDRRSRVSRFRVDASDPNQTEPGSRVDVITFDQPFGNHNGGQIAFGPDGMLYIGLGDGGSANDPGNRAQDRTIPLGGMLRIDVSTLPYTIPDGNPYKGNTDGYLEEIWAYGLRNPWRFSFDAANGSLWTGDVGQDAREEINIVEAGRNYGWKIMEGSICRPPTTGCATAGLELPVWEYEHRGGGRSITGGFVYRGSALPGLVGKYIYADFMTGELWALATNGTPDNDLLEETGLGISSFGVDEEGELYFCAFDGYIYRIVGK